MSNPPGGGAQEEHSNSAARLFDDRLSGDLSALDDFAQELSHLGRRATEQASTVLAGEPSTSGAGLPGKISVDPESVEGGLAKLVLTLIERLRRLLEKQAMRRIDAG